MNGPRWIAAALVAAGLWTGPMDAAAQDMPDPSLIHGRAIPAGELANGTVTVRVVREAIGNNVSGQQVRVTADGRTYTATTDDLGRAEFRDIPPGSAARAETRNCSLSRTAPSVFPTAFPTIKKRPPKRRRRSARRRTGLR